jgi:UDP-glucose 4-epimerase
VEACIFHQIEMVDGVAVIGEECKGCGRCAAVCKSGSIKIEAENPRYVEETIERINSYVDVT